MSSATDKQGQIGNLEEKTLPELRELLQRQEKLLQKQKFLQTLPDKGIKVKNFAEKLHKLIEEKELQTKHTVKCSPKQQTVQDVVQQKGDHSESDSLSACMERVSISNIESVRDDGNVFINSYERIIKRANEKPAIRVFKPHSTLKISKVQDLPEKFTYKPTSRYAEEKLKHKNMDCEADPQRHSPRCSRVKEESAVHIPDYKHEHTLLISVEESVQLQDDQKKNLETVQARQAAERLAQRLHIQMDDYNPEGTDMKYRIQAHDTDSDDEPELEGYDD